MNSSPSRFSIRIGVATQTMAKKTAALLAELEEKPLIEVQPTWYY